MGAYVYCLEHLTNKLAVLLIQMCTLYIYSNGEIIAHFEQ